MPAISIQRHRRRRPRPRRLRLCFSLGRRIRGPSDPNHSVYDASSTPGGLGCRSDSLFPVNAALDRGLTPASGAIIKFGVCVAVCVVCGDTFFYLLTTWSLERNRGGELATRERGVRGDRGMYPRVLPLRTRTTCYFTGRSLSARPDNQAATAAGERPKRFRREPTALDTKPAESRL